ncbi:MAG: molybdenum cofactor guanylyltransferase [Sphingobacteriaceae bacterium]|nr:molybdenum cofactor guanylyltransferase [Cytophagaceae bacterium]
MPTATVYHPPLHGLVLAGGRSIRMGRDKGLIAYHGMPEREAVFQRLQPFCVRVFLSLNAEQAATANPDFPFIVDEIPDAGPLSGLLTAFRHHPDHAWLTAPCDLPFLTENTIGLLVEARNSKQIATTFRGSDGWPEPLVAIWEPAALPLLQTAFKRGHGPRRILLENEPWLLDPPDFAEFRNMNTPDFE